MVAFALQKIHFSNVRYWREADIRSWRGRAGGTRVAPRRQPSDFDLLGYA